MARASPGWRRRSDGVYQLDRRGPRVRAGPLALGLLLAAFGLVLAALSAPTVRLGFSAALALALAAAVLLVRRARRRARPPAAPAATVLALARRAPGAPFAARDAGA